MQERRRRPHMRPEASILSARCEIREIPLTVEYSTTETDSTALSFVAELTRSNCPLVWARGSTCLRRVCGARHSSTGVRGFPLTALYTCDRAARRGAACGEIGGSWDRSARGAARCVVTDNFYK